MNSNLVDRVLSKEGVKALDKAIEKGAQGVVKLGLLPTTLPGQIALGGVAVIALMGAFFLYRGSSAPEQKK